MSLSQLLTAAGDIISFMITNIGYVIKAIFNPVVSGGTDTISGSWGSLAPFLFIGLGITLILTAVGVVRSFVAGRNM